VTAELFVQQDPLRELAPAEVLPHHPARVGRALGFSRSINGANLFTLPDR
jgi:hypothetical protein